MVSSVPSDDDLKRDLRNANREERRSTIEGIQAMTSTNIYAAHELYQQLLKAMQKRGSRGDQQAMLMAGAVLISAVWNGSLVLKEEPK